MTQERPMEASDLLPDTEPAGCDVRAENQRLRAEVDRLKAALRSADWALQPFSDRVIDPSGSEPSVLPTQPDTFSPQRFFDARAAYRKVRAALAPA